MGPVPDSDAGASAGEAWAAWAAGVTIDPTMFGGRIAEVAVTEQEIEKAI